MRCGTHLLSIHCDNYCFRIKCFFLIIYLYDVLRVLQLRGSVQGFKQKFQKQTAGWCVRPEITQIRIIIVFNIYYIYNTRLAIFARGILLAAAAAAAAMCCKYLSRKFHPENELMWGINIYERENLPEGEISSEYGFFPLR